MNNSSLLQDAIEDAKLVRTAAQANANARRRNHAATFPSPKLSETNFSAMESVEVVFPLWVGSEQVLSEAMGLINRVYEHHGDDDSGSLFVIQDVLDAFFGNNDGKVIPMMTSPAVIAKFGTFKLPFNIGVDGSLLAKLSSWPRESSSTMNSGVIIRIDGQLCSAYFIGYDVDNSEVTTPLRLLLKIHCQRGLSGTVMDVLVPLLKDSGHFYVVGEFDVDGETVNGVELKKLCYKSKSGKVHELTNRDVCNYPGRSQSFPTPAAAA